MWSRYEDRSTSPWLFFFFFYLSGGAYLCRALHWNLETKWEKNEKLQNGVSFFMKNNKIFWEISIKLIKEELLQFILYCNDLLEDRPIQFTFEQVWCLLVLKTNNIERATKNMNSFQNEKFSFTNHIFFFLSDHLVQIKKKERLIATLLATPVANAVNDLTWPLCIPTFMFAVACCNQRYYQFFFLM